MNITERMFEIMKIKGIKQKELAEAIGINSANISAWNKRNTNPPIEYLPQICSRLEVSWEYLITGEEKKNPYLNPEETELLNIYRQLDKHDKKEIIGIINLKLEQKKAENKILNSKIG